MGMQNRKQYVKWKPGDKVKPKTLTGPGRTKQEFANEANINTIMERYRRTGQLPSVPFPQEAQFADVSGLGSFAEVQQRVHRAEEAFASLPAKIRTRFNNNSAELVEFLQDGRNYDEAVSLGLVIKKEEPPVTTPEPKAPTNAVPAEPPKA